jgi:hypothetical protein
MRRALHSVINFWEVRVIAGFCVFMLRGFAFYIFPSQIIAYFTFECLIIVLICRFDRIEYIHKLFLQIS